eukprot:CAMPEP_0203757786 /NCGR_PEP_ID=MMETSP0098-20131031/10688_1 /ASSEMBLY_ACC=CAM_ASM_000208 /TAXON_ID=96639 /ORGANISM=" , Strain NY0313808BC1" /LENGTH=942 /DNA_ID=CAMNT_0050650019 /DNA_START=270 /DNA_END=3094 /DNA_ORIENTATION=+
MSSSIRRIVFKGPGGSGRSATSARDGKEEPLGNQLAELLGVRAVYEVDENEFMRDKFLQVSSLGFAGRRGISDGWNLSEKQFGTVWKPRIMMITTASILLFSVKKSTSPVPPQGPVAGNSATTGNDSMKSLRDGSGLLIGRADEIKTTIPLEDVTFACEFVDPKGTDDMIVQIRATQVTGNVRTTFVRCADKTIFENLMRTLEIGIKAYRSSMDDLRENLFSEESSSSRTKCNVSMVTVGNKDRQLVACRYPQWEAEIKLHDVSNTNLIRVYYSDPVNGGIYCCKILPYHVKIAMENKKKDQETWIRVDPLDNQADNQGDGSKFKPMSLKIEGSIRRPVGKEGAKQKIAPPEKEKAITLEIQETRIVIMVCLCVVAAVLAPQWMYTREKVIAMLAVPVGLAMLYVRGQQGHKKVTSSAESTHGQTSSASGDDVVLKLLGVQPGLIKRFLYWEQTEEMYRAAISDRNSALAAAGAMGSSSRKRGLSESKEGIDGLISALGGADDEHWDDADCPQKWFDATDGNRADAIRQWKESLQWRKDNDIDAVLSKPQSHFFTIKQLFPHCWFGLDKNGHLVTLERFGTVKKNVQDLKAAGVTAEAFADHCVFMNEYWIHNKITKTGRLNKIVDLKGFGISQLSKEVINYFQPMNHAMQQYPELLIKVNLINAPSSFRFAWRIVTPFLAKKTTEKIQVLSGNEKTIIDTLTGQIDTSILPPEYGGTMELDMTDIELEKTTAAYVRKLNKNAGVPNTDDWLEDEDELMAQSPPIIPIATPEATAAAGGVTGDDNRILELLVGDWKTDPDKSDSMAPVLELQGVNWMKVKAAGMVTPNQSIQVTGGDQAKAIKIVTKTGPIKVVAEGVINGRAGTAENEGSATADSVVVRMTNPPAHLQEHIMDRCVELAFDLASGDRRIVSHGIDKSDSDTKFMSITYIRAKDNKSTTITL